MEEQTHLAFEIFNQADYGVVLVDQYHQVQIWNKWMEAQTSLSLSDVIANPIKHAVSEQVLPSKVLAAVNETLQYGQPISVANGDDSPYFYELKRIILSEQSFCLLEIYDSNSGHSSEAKSLEELSFQYEQELALTSHLLDTISGMKKFSLPGVSVWQKEKDAGNFSGDLVLSAPRPSGGINILIGDFVGRGLSAAVGALPVAEVFYGMTGKGFGLSDIIEELNQKLLFILPDGLFCAACLIELEHEGKMLAVWNGGLPDLLVMDEESNIKYRVPSSHIPLGIHSNAKIDLETVFVEVEAGDKVVCCTDGLLNAKNSLGEKFGAQQVERILMQGQNLPEIQQAIIEHIAGTEQQDDISVTELDISAIQNFEGVTTIDQKQTGLPPAHWLAEFEFSAQVLRTVDLVPLLVNVLMHIQAPHDHRQRIYTVLAEMCSNALEHGVLSLPSAMKKSANGFADYYALRALRLTKLAEGYIKVSLSHQPRDSGGALTIRVEDSGKGFDFKQRAKDLANNSTLSGRGEALLQKLCSSYNYSGKGNIIQAEYHWIT